MKHSCDDTACRHLWDRRTKGAVNNPQALWVPSLGLCVVLLCMTPLAFAQSKGTVGDSGFPTASNIILQPFTLVQAMREALQRYPAVQASRYQLASAGADVSKAEGARWPVLSVGAAAMQSGLLNSTSQTLTPQASYAAYAGGAIEAGVEKAQHLMRAAQSKLDVTQDDVAYQAGEAYLQWARATEQVKLAKKNLYVVEQIRDDVQAIVKVDSGRLVDLNQAQVRVKVAALFVSQREGELAQAKTRLSRYVHADMHHAIPTDGPGWSSPASLELALTTLEDRHPALEQARAQLQAADAAVVIARAQVRPKVDVSVARQINPNNLTPYTLSQVSLNMPVFNGGVGQAGVQGAIEQREAARSALDEQLLVSREKISASWAEWRLALERSQLSLDQAQAGEALVDNYRLQFKLARRSLLDVLNVQNETYGYQAASVQAGFDVRIAQLKLTSGMGKLVQVIREVP
jgi:adhesin transport system outer membrane protein